MKIVMRNRSGLTLVELLVVIAIVGLLVALLLPAVQQSRESARRIDCQNNLKQIGLSTFAYHDSFKSFASGYIGQNPDPADGQGWGWAALQLPFVEQSGLHEDLIVIGDRLSRAVNDPRRRPLLARVLPTFLCPSDPSWELGHDNRTLTGFPLPVGPRAPLTTGYFHPGHAPGAGVNVGKSNYVGSFGDGWDPTTGPWQIDRLRGNGVFGCNSRVRLKDIRDGTPHVFMAGERSWDAYAAAWVGVDQWNECATFGVSMVLGTVFYRQNEPPEPYALSCNGRGSAGFGSQHPNGSQFVMCDGSVHFISEEIEFRNSINPDLLGTYQRLGQREDGGAVGAF